MTNKLRRRISSHFYRNKNYGASVIEHGTMGENYIGEAQIST